MKVAGIWGGAVKCGSLGRLAQRKSTRFTREGSLVQIQYRPPEENASQTENPILLAEGFSADLGRLQLSYSYEKVATMIVARAPSSISSN